MILDGALAVPLKQWRDKKKGGPIGSPFFIAFGDQTGTGHEGERRENTPPALASLPTVWEKGRPRIYWST